MAASGAAGGLGMAHARSKGMGLPAAALAEQGVPRYPVWKGEVMSHQDYQSCIEACVQCAQECEHCANACLAEREVAKMAECIRRDLDCAQICWTAAGYMSRDSRFMQDICRVCAEICEACGAECRKHPAEHCQQCAEACDHCAEECRHMAGAASR